MTIQPIGNVGAPASMLTASEDSAVQERMNAAAMQRGKNGQAETRAEQQRAQADRTTFSSRYWNPGETIDFSMGTYTRNGIRVQVEAGERSLTLGHFANKGPLENTFKLSGARADLNMTVTFTTADGKSTSYKVNESMTFHENKNGEIEEGSSMDRVRDKDDPTQTHQETNIVINMDDKASAVGGDGHDVLLNFASEASINGGGGDDTIVNMGNKTKINGGDGDDFIKLVKDVMRPETKSTVALGALRDEDTVPLWGVDRNIIDLDAMTMVDSMAGQEVTIDAGDGDDTVDARGVKLERADVKAGAGNDAMLFGELVASNVHGGEGDDYIEADTVLKSTIDGGAGNDTLDVGQIKDSVVDGGAGNDALRVNQAHGTDILGGDGDDTIDLGSAYESVIDGGDGNDAVSARVLDRSILSGGKGDDVLVVDQALSSVIDGGAGDDLISVNVFENTTNSARMGAYRTPMILGGSGKDTILVGAANQGIIAGDDGDDTIVIGRSENSIISGGKGDDSIRTGISGNNIIDGGDGSNDIRLNLQVDPEDMMQARYVEQNSMGTNPDVDLQAYSQSLKQQAEAHPQGDTLTDDQWLQLAEERLNSTTVHAKGVSKGPDVVVDNGRLVQGTADQLADLVQQMSWATGDVPDEVAEIAPYTRKWRGGQRSGTLLNPNQKTALKGYLDSLQQLAQSEGAGTLAGRLVK